MKKAFQYLLVFGFAYALLFLGALTLYLPKDTVSISEKRKLASFPEFDGHNILFGYWSKNFSKYFSDHFAFRKDWLDLGFMVQNQKGLMIENVKIYQNDNLLDGNLTISEEMIVPKEQKSDSVMIPDSVTGEAKMVVDKQEFFTPQSSYLDSLQEQGVGRTTNNVFICNGKGFQFFGGNNEMARAYARIVNRYGQQLPGVNVYCAIVPSNSEFYLPQKYQKMKRSECENIAETYKNLKYAKVVDICEEIYQHLDEYLYFNTDHHWTGLGAYYGYVAWCKAAEVPPVPLDSMKRKVIRNYYGTLYHLTQDRELARNKDSVEYFKSNVKTKTWYWLENQMNKPYLGTYLVEFAGSATAYGVFLGADYPLMKIETNANTGRNVLVIKNSYGNPFTTYLVNHFNNVYAIDYRYYHQQLNSLIRKNNITDVIFLMGVFSTNTISHIKKVDWLLGYEKVKIQEKTEEIQKNDDEKK